MTAAERAAVAADRLNAAAQPLRTTVGLTLEARGLESNPVIGLVGRPEALLEVTEEDAAAYNEDWTGLRGRGGPVTRARLARWWEALARDLVLLTVRAQAPQHAAALAPEGRALGSAVRDRAAQRSRRRAAPGRRRGASAAARGPAPAGPARPGLGDGSERRRGRRRGRFRPPPRRPRRPRCSSTAPGAAARSSRGSGST